MCLNIGYSIGFGYPAEENNDYLYFSTLYVLIGASLVGAALGFFAEQVSQDKNVWFTRLEEKKKMESKIEFRNRNRIFHGKVRAWFFHYATAMQNGLP
jgi:hypothetical protein